MIFTLVLLNYQLGKNFSAEKGLLQKNEFGFVWALETLILTLNSKSKNSQFLNLDECQVFINCPSFPRDQIPHYVFGYFASDYCFT